MGGTLCHFLGASPSNDGVCPICNKICPTKGKGDKAEAVKLEDKETELISASWKIFMEKVNENGMAVLLICIKKHPKYKEAFGADKPEDEIKKDERINSHLNATTKFLNDLVENMNDQAKIESIVAEIANYQKTMKIPPSAMIITKENPIRLPGTSKQTMAAFTNEECADILFLCGYCNGDARPAVEECQDYKDCLINYMLDKKITTKEGGKAWHHFTDKVLEGIKKVPKYVKLEEPPESSAS